jgi:hypothetical protein
MRRKHAAEACWAVLEGLPLVAPRRCPASRSARVRANGLAISYAFGVARFGGTVQSVVTALIKWTGDPDVCGLVYRAVMLGKLLRSRAIQGAARRRLTPGRKRRRQPRLPPVWMARVMIGLVTSTPFIWR